MGSNCGVFPALRSRSRRVIFRLRAAPARSIGVTDCRCLASVIARAAIVTGLKESFLILGRAKGEIVFHRGAHSIIAHTFFQI
jgi:hypothetical protein